MYFQTFTKRVYHKFYGKQSRSPNVAFVKCLGTLWLYVQGFRCKGFFSTPGRLLVTFYATVGYILFGCEDTAPH